MKPTGRSQLLASCRRARPAVAAALAVAAGLFSPQPPQAHAQRSIAGSGSSEMTIFTSPPDARVTLQGSSEILGIAPLDLGALWTGRYSVTVDAPGYATARGALFFPQRGARPTLRSEPPGISGLLLLRSLNFPGVPALTSHHTGRGIAFLAAGAGGLGAVIRDHVAYRDKLKKADVESQDRARDFRYARDRWEIYTGAVWGLSALDYMIRPRMALLESMPTRVTIGAPKLGRAAVLWRSILVPGAGQDYANRKVRGLIWLGATLASGAAYLVADESHHRIVTKLERAEALLATASPAEVPDRQADVDHFTSLEETSRQLVDGLAIGTAGIYAANVIDAVIVPLGGRPAAARKVSLSTPLSPRRAEIAITYRY